MIRSIVILGAGTAGLLAALTLRRNFAQTEIRVIHSRELGVIGVGEGTTPLFPRHLLHVLGLDPARLYADAQPIWKLGIRCFWGPRPHFFYSFGQQFDARWSDLPKANGYYCDEEYLPADIPAALMASGRAALRHASGWPQLHSAYAFHIENARLVEYLRARCLEAGVGFTDGMVKEVEAAAENEKVTALLLDSGERVSGDLFVDASGFRSELLGGALREPFLRFDDALFCDRAIIGGWERTDEAILPYTTAETMQAGWCWQIEHERFINRGYVFSSQFLSDDEARKEFLEKNPQITPGREPRLVGFRSGRYARNWVGNVVAIGNANGFVEPLEATAIAVTIYAVQALVEILREGAPPSPGMRAIYNQLVADVWTETRDFLALHYRFNEGRIDSAFWRMCRAETPLRTVEPVVEFYRENGPSMLARHCLGHHDNIFGLEGHLALLVGQAVPHRGKHEPSPAERATWRQHAREIMAQAQAGFTVAETLACVRHPNWRWS
jgi:tryptophan halogenase